MIRATTFAGKRVAVFGLGASGRATVLSLVAGGAEVAAWDDGELSRDAARQAGVPIVDLNTADWSTFAALVLAPGVPLTHPEPHWTVAKARAVGIEIIGDIEIFCRERRAHAPGSPFIAITGTNGKSTTTALIAHILRTAGLDAQMGGNIGVAILSLEEPAPVAGGHAPVAGGQPKAQATSAVAGGPAPVAGGQPKAQATSAVAGGPAPVAGGQPKAQATSAVAGGPAPVAGGQPKAQATSAVAGGPAPVAGGQPKAQATSPVAGGQPKAQATSPVAGRHAQAHQKSPVHVIEMSSFQIDLTPSLDPTIGVLLNLSADHLDRHGPADDATLAMQNYSAVKERLIVQSDVAVVGVDDDQSLAVLKRRIAMGPVAPLSAKRSVAPGYCEHDGWLICADATGLAVKLATTTGIATLRGTHNVQNALAAIAVVRELLALKDWQLDVDWQAALATYPGLPHRMEQVGRKGRVTFINDSKATNADSTEKALASWDRDIFWIAGGTPKEGGIRPLEAYFPRIAKAYLIGKSSDDFAATLDNKVSYERCVTLDVALTKATADATQCLGAEPVVLLSPACASYDQFRSFEHRGDTFRDLVRALPGVER